MVECLIDSTEGEVTVNRYFVWIYGVSSFHIVGESLIIRTSRDIHSLDNRIILFRMTYIYFGQFDITYNI